MTTTTRLENKLQAIYIANGYDITCDNRSYFTKSINKALTNPNVIFQLCDKGKVWRRDENYVYNLRILIQGKGKTFKIKDFSPEKIAECFANVAKMDHVKETIKIYQDAYVCDKCRGKGIIPAFMHVCKGVCFDCLGVGYKFHSCKW